MFTKQFQSYLFAIVPVVGLSFLVTSVPVMAQSVIEEVIVTAQKREESVQDIGIAITAFSGEQMEALGLTNGTEIAAFTPGVHISGNNGGHTQQFTIRGSTQNDFADVAEGPNAVYVDEAYQATGQSQLFANYDMERVEILKGPQGTLFGRNATGGLIHFLTKKPTHETSAYADVTYGAYDTVRVEAAVNGALSDTVAGRLSFMHNSHNAVMKNDFTDADLPPTPFISSVLQGRGPLTSNPDNHDDLWTDDQNAARAQLLIEPNEDLTVLVKGHWAESKPASGPYQHVATMPYLDTTDADGDGAIDLDAGGNPVLVLVDTKRMSDLDPTDPLSSCEQINISTNSCTNAIFDLDFDGVRPNNRGDLFGFFEADGEDGLRVKTDHTTDDNDSVEVWGLTGKIEIEMDWAKLISVSNYSNQTKQQSLDVDSGPAPQFIVMNQSSFQWGSQELRLEGETDDTRWIAGMYYLSIDGKYTQGLADTIGGINVFCGAFFGFFAPGVFLQPDGTPVDAAGGNTFCEGTLTADIETHSYSLFGQVDYDFAEQWTLVLGIRGIREKKQYAYNSRLYTNLRDERNDSAVYTTNEPYTAVFTGGAPFEFLLPHTESVSDYLWSGKAQLNYKWNDDLLLYFGVNRGVKAGSFNAPLLTNLTSDQYFYDPEILVSYEGGFKSTFWDGKARLNGAFYYYDYSDYQAFQFIGTSGAVFNADAEYYGGELELYTNPMENLDLIMGLGLIDPTVKDVNVAPGKPRDVEPSFTPKTQWSGIARYTIPNMFAGGTLALQMDAIYRSRAFHNINNFGSHRMPAYWLGNASVDWKSSDEAWTVGAFVDNFTDTRNQLIGFELSTVCGCDEASYGKPRWWGVKVRYDY